MDAQARVEVCIDEETCNDSGNMPELLQFKDNTDIATICSKLQVSEGARNTDIYRSVLSDIQKISQQRNIPTQQLIDELDSQRTARKLPLLIVEESGGTKMHTCLADCNLCKQDATTETLAKGKAGESAMPRKMSSSSRPLQAYVNGKYVVASADPTIQEPVDKMGHGWYLVTRHRRRRPDMRSSRFQESGSSLNQNIGNGFRVHKPKRGI